MKAKKQKPRINPNYYKLSFSRFEAWYNKARAGDKKTAAEVYVELGGVLPDSVKKTLQKEKKPVQDKQKKPTENKAAKPIKKTK